MTIFLFLRAGSSLSAEDDSWFKHQVLVDTEIYWFDFDRDETTETSENSDTKIRNIFDFSGRQKKLEYNFKPVNLLTANYTITILDAVTLGVTYGSDRFSFASDNKVENELSSIKANDSSELINLNAAIFGLRFKYEDFKFNSGSIDVIDVSNDPNGETGVLSETINSSLSFRSTETILEIGELINKYFKKGNGSLMLRCFQISYLESRIRLPIIPYTYDAQVFGSGESKTYDYEYVSEGQIQLADFKSQKFGFGLEGKYLEAMVYLGDNKTTAFDSSGVLREIETDGFFAKLRGTFIKDYVKSWGTISPMLGLSLFYYNLSETPDAPSENSSSSSTQQVTLFGGDFAIIQLKAALSISF